MLVFLCQIVALFLHWDYIQRNLFGALIIKWIFPANDVLDQSDVWQVRRKMFKVSSIVGSLGNKISFAFTQK